MTRIFFLLLMVVCINTGVVGQLYINEVCPANADINFDEYYNFSGWIELYNAGSSAVDIGGYYLSDNINEKDKWKIPSGATIPARGYLVFWCDGVNKNFHTNFSLDAEGEEVLFSTSGLAQVDHVEFPQQYANVSYGRSTDGSNTWSFSIQPSPKNKNVSIAAKQPLTAVTISPKGGRYSGAQTVSISHPSPSVEIRYTVDGSEPSRNSPLYSAAVIVSSTQVVKAKAFSVTNTYLPSATAVGTYFINEHEFTLPVVSLSTKQAYLTDDIIGIYASGTNGISGNCQTVPRNWNQDWDRHADIEYFSKTGVKQFDQAVDMRISGACSRGMAQKSFAIKARSKYGNNVFDERLFSEKDIDQYGGFFLRNSGNDFNTTSFRDAFMQKLAASQMDLDYMAYQPAILYLNGKYWGIQNLREKIDADYFESNYGIDKDDLDLLETNETALEGTKDAYVNYKNALQGMNPSDPSTFDFIDSNIDVQEYINYLVAEIYYCNTDWPGNNQKFWRQRSTNGKFRWVLWDTDFGFGMYNDKSYPTHPTLNFATDATKTDWPNPAWSTLHIRLVLQNPVFRTRFIQTLNAAMLTTFSAGNVITLINKFQEALKTEMPYHKTRWGGTLNDWNSQVQKLRDFAVSRNEFMQQHTATFFGLNERVRLNVKTLPINSGSYKLNGIVTQATVTEGSYFKDLPFQVEALPHAGFVFKQWNIRKQKSTPVPMIQKGSMWKYFTQGVMPASDWPSAEYNDATWSSGQAQLGYGEGDEKTVVSYGSDSNNKFITTYFRKTFSLASIADLEDIKASILFDDGVIVYLNGTEVYRNNMPAGVINTTTLALQAEAIENVFKPLVINKNLLVVGDNIVAVELHQNSPQSSDASFDFEMNSVVLGNETNKVVNLPNLVDTAYTDISLEAIFEPIATNVISDIIINEFCASNSTVKDNANENEDWIELYNNGTKIVDIAGLYITDNLNFKTKHKIAPGGAQTVINPGQYLLLWADHQTEQGATHVNFKLSAKGEDLGLFQILGHDTIVLEQLSFERQADKGSTARIPNGNGSFISTSTITPASENILEIVLGVENLDETIFLHPNPVTSHFYVEAIAPIKYVTLCDLFGRPVKYFNNVQPGAPLLIDTLSPGLYLVKIASRGYETLVRIIKK